MKKQAAKKIKFNLFCGLLLVFHIFDLIIVNFYKMIFLMYKTTYHKYELKKQQGTLGTWSKL